MVDNVAYKSDASTTVATIRTDDDGTAQWQYVKLAYGADNTQTIVTSTATNPLPVALSDTDNAVLDSIAAAQLPDGHNVTVDNASIAVDITTPLRTSQGDGIPTTADGVGVSAYNYVFNGTTLDLMREGAVAGSLLVDGNGGTFTVDNAGTFAVQSSANNTISTNNSTTTPLGISGVFTGTGDDVSNYAAITIQLDSDQDSATDGMTFQFSSDNTNWDDVYNFTYTAADGARRFQFPVTAQYFRIVFTNGGTGQTHFRVQTILHSTNVTTSIHRLSDNIDPDRSAQVVKSALIAQAAGSGDFIPIQTTAGGNLKISIEEVDATNLPTNTVQLGGSAVSMNTGVRDAGTQRVTIATDDSVPVTGTFWQATQPVSGSVTADLGANNDVQGQVAHDAAFSGNPFGVGFEAIAHGTNPTAVAAADMTKAYANRAGIPFVIGGHPNVLTQSARNTAAQTDTALVTVAGGAKIVCTRVEVTCDNSNSVDVDFEVGFGATTVPTAATGTGVAGMLADFMGVPPGGGMVTGNGGGILGIGALGEDLRYSNTVPTGGNCTITVSYYTIES